LCMTALLNSGRITFRFQSIFIIGSKIPLITFCIKENTVYNVSKELHVCPCVHWCYFMYRRMSE
jgi:hypothetical protein